MQVGATARKSDEEIVNEYLDSIVRKTVLID